MANIKSKELAAFEGADSNTIPQPAQNAYNAKLRRFIATIDLANGGTPIVPGDKIDIAMPPRGMRFAFGTLITPQSLADATIAVSARHTDPKTGEEVLEAGKYGAARTFTTPQQPILFGSNTGTGERLQDEVVYLEIAAAALPTSGTMVVDLFFSAV